MAEKYSLQPGALQLPPSLQHGLEDGGPIVEEEKVEAAKQEDLSANWEAFRGDDEQEAMTAEQGKLLRVQTDELNI